MIETSMCVLVVAVVVLGAARAVAASLQSVGQAKRTTDAAIFLETTMEDISTQPYENLLALNGNVIYDRTNAGDSSFSVGLSVFLAEVDLLQIRAELTDLRSNTPMGRVIALRSRR